MKSQTEIVPVNTPARTITLRPQQSEDMRLQRSQQRSALKMEQSRERQVAYQAASSILANPITLTVLGVLAIEYFQSSEELRLVPDVNNEGYPLHRYKKVRVPGGGWVGSVAGSAAEAGIIAAAAAMSAGNLAKELEPLTKALAPIIPALVK